jgi:hypothetical protein
VQRRIELVHGEPTGHYSDHVVVEYQLKDGNS